jgi:hypothetical protein
MLFRREVELPVSGEQRLKGRRKHTPLAITPSGQCELTDDVCHPLLAHFRPDWRTDVRATPP